MLFDVKLVSLFIITMPHYNFHFGVNLKGNIVFQLKIFLHMCKRLVGMYKIKISMSLSVGFDGY